jgi:cytochrome c oxidase cbb3-type subunit 4
MDINDLRSITTVVTMAFFAGIVWWAYSSRHKEALDEAAQLPLMDDDSEHLASGNAGHADK